jgi:hypothetical protein
LCASVSNRRAFDSGGHAATGGCTLRESSYLRNGHETQHMRDVLSHHATSCPRGSPLWRDVLPTAPPLGTHLEGVCGLAVPSALRLHGSAALHATHLAHHLLEMHVLTAAVSPPSAGALGCWSWPSWSSTNASGARSSPGRWASHGRWSPVVSAPRRGSTAGSGLRH